MVNYEPIGRDVDEILHRIRSSDSGETRDRVRPTLSCHRAIKFRIDRDPRTCSLHVNLKEDCW